MGKESYMITLDPNVLQAVTDLADVLGRAGNEMQSMRIRLLGELQPALEVLQHFGKLAMIVPVKDGSDSAKAGAEASMPSEEDVIRILRKALVSNPGFAIELKNLLRL